MTVDQRWLDVRAYRDRKLRECDWVVLRAFEAGLPVPPAWMEYRTALRDIPQLNADPFKILWPVQP